MCKGRILLLGLVMVLLIAACGKADTMFNQSYIIVNDDQTLSVTLMEDFTESYYNETELMEMVNSEVSQYNAGRGADAIGVGEHHLENGLLTLELEFADVQSFNDYMPEVVFCGTLQEAYNAGYDLNRSLNVVGNEGTTIGKNELQNMGESRVFILSGVMDVQCPDKIKYYSQGMVMLDAYTVSATGSGCYFIIY